MAGEFEGQPSFAPSGPADPDTAKSNADPAALLLSRTYGRRARASLDMGSDKGPDKMRFGEKHNMLWIRT